MVATQYYDDSNMRIIPLLLLEAICLLAAVAVVRSLMEALAVWCVLVLAAVTVLRWTRIYSEKVSSIFYPSADLARVLNNGVRNKLLRLLGLACIGTVAPIAIAQRDLSLVQEFGLVSPVIIALADISAVRRRWRTGDRN